jgi:hypothetical protein
VRTYRRSGNGASGGGDGGGDDHDNFGSRYHFGPQLIRWVGVDSACSSIKGRNTMSSDKDAEKVKELSQKLGSWFTASPNEVMGWLKELEDREITKPILFESKVGVVVNRLAKTHKDPAVTEIAKQLVKSWKESVNLGSPAPSPKAPPDGDATTSDNAKQAMKEAVEANGKEKPGAAFKDLESPATNDGEDPIETKEQPEAAKTRERMVSVDLQDSGSEAQAKSSGSRQRSGTPHSERMADVVSEASTKHSSKKRKAASRSRSRDSKQAKADKDDRGDNKRRKAKHSSDASVMSEKDMIEWWNTYGQKDMMDWWNNTAGSYSAGDTVEYFSASAKKWVECMVIKFHADKGVYDLTVKKAALASNIRMPPNGVKPIGAGDAVLYHSASSGRWLQAKVIRYRADKNLYDLTIKAGADPKMIKRNPKGSVGCTRLPPDLGCSTQRYPPQGQRPQPEDCSGLGRSNSRLWPILEGLERAGWCTAEE